MIAWLSGTVLVKQANTLILVNGGVGYELAVPVSVIEQTGQGQAVELFVHHAQREDGQYLYGFSSLNQRQLFRELIRISGIGPKLGLLILSGFTPEGLVQAVNEQNSAAFVKLPGIGKKTAERLLIELKDRIGQKYAHLRSGEVSGESSAFVAGAAQEALEALIALELKPAEAAKLVDQASRDLPAEADSAQIIKAAFALKLQGGR